MGEYAKAVVALVVAAGVAVATAIGTGSVEDLDGAGWVKVALVVLGGTAATWWAENGPAAPKVKAFLGAATAGLTAWMVAYENDQPVQYVISQGEWITIGLAVVGAFTAVYQVPNGARNVGG